MCSGSQSARCCMWLSLTLLHASSPTHKVRKGRTQKFSDTSSHSLRSFRFCTCTRGHRQGSHARLWWWLRWCCMKELIHPLLCPPPSSSPTPPLFISPSFRQVSSKGNTRLLRTVSLRQARHKKIWCGVNLFTIKACLKILKGCKE